MHASAVATPEAIVLSSFFNRWKSAKTQVANLLVLVLLHTTIN